MDIYLAKAQGFCVGVARAVDIVNSVLKQNGPPIYVYHEIIHNTYVVNNFIDRGIIFVDDINDVPEGERVIFSAHGIPPEIIERAKAKKIRYLDATCPLVTKVHHEAVKFSKKRYEIILIGHRGHQELIGTMGYVEPKLLHIVENEEDVAQLDINPSKDIAYLTQTTLSVDETKRIIDKLKHKFPKLISSTHSDICYATQNRQDAVIEISRVCDLIIICGSPNSSNCNRLRETGAKKGVPSYLIDRYDELDFGILQGKLKVGISSGASVPRWIIDELVVKIKEKYAVGIIMYLGGGRKIAQ